MDHRGAWNVREWMTCKNGIEFEETHTVSCPTPIWNKMDLKDL